METLHFSVAHHPFHITAPDIGAVLSLLPSYLPFLRKEEDLTAMVSSAPVFTLELTTKSVDTNAPLYTTFSWDEAQCSVYRNETEYAFEVQLFNLGKSFRMTCDTQFKRGKMQWQEKDTSFPYALGNFLMMLYAFSTATKQTLLMHASVIRNKEYGYLFQGKSGTGKSTHSSLWLKHIEGSELLNDDNPVIRVINGEAIVYGSPWSGKTPCYRNEEVPIGAFVRLTQASENKIERQGTAGAFASVLSSCSILKWDTRIHNGICDTAGLLATTTPVYHLHCLPDKAAAELSFKTITPQ